jgi:signal peptidase I
MQGTFSKKQLEQIKKIKGVDSINQRIDSFAISKEIVKKAKNNKWTLDNLGPILIPKKGMVIPINAETHFLYKRILKQFEKCLIIKKSDSYFLNKKKITNYTFKQNYYFMMGDNRKGTIDSRTWGFLPEANIVGKVQCVLFSNYQDKFQWNRLFLSTQE